MLDLSRGCHQRPWQQTAEAPDLRVREWKDGGWQSTVLFIFNNG